MSEYERLTSEILARESEIVQYHSILYTATAAILVFAFDKSNYLYFLLPYFVIIPLQLLAESARRNICRIYAYIFVFLDGKEYLYDGRHHKYNLRMRQKYGTIYYFFKQMRYRSEYFIVLILCAVLSIHTVISADIERKCYPIMFISIIMIVAIIFVSFNRTDYVRTTQKFISRWQAIKAAEEAQKRKNNRNPQ